jgi:hypothetical protein
MTDNQLAAILAERVMGWTVAPDRFMTGERRWIPRWRFQPTKRLEDAFRLLECATLQEYAMGTDGNGGRWASVRIAGVTGAAQANSEPLALTLAVARAVGIEV